MATDQDGPENTFEIEETNEETNEESKPALLTKGMQLYLLAMLCGSLMKACSKLLVERLDLFLVLFFRMIITAAISLVSMHLKHVDHYFWGAPGVRILLSVRGLLGSFNIACTYFALKYLSLPDQAAISFLTPLVTMILAKLLLGEQYQLQQAGASLLSLVGVFVIAKPSFLFGSAHEPTNADVMRSLAVASTLCVVLSAAMVMIVLRKIRDRAHALASVSNYAVQTVFFSMVVLTVRGQWALPHSAYVWFLIFCMGTFGFALQYFSSMAIQMEEATSLANLKYTQLIYATSLEVILWHDVPDFVSWIGIVLVLSGVVISSKLKQKSKIHQHNLPVGAAIPIQP